MPRIARNVLNKIPTHITQRGNNKQVVFLDADDKWVFIKLLAKYAKKYKVPIHSFCLMDNHYHIACTPPTKCSLAKMFGQLNWGFATFHNKKYGKSGHLWQERFASTQMTGLHFVRAMRYIELNPVTAGLVSSPLDWIWSSARISCGLQYEPPWFELPSWWHSYFNGDKWLKYLLEDIEVISK